MFYAKIKEIRVLKKITEGVMASELKINMAYYIAIESGAIDLELSLIFKIIEILGITPSDLFDSVENYVSYSLN